MKKKNMELVVVRWKVKVTGKERRKYSGECNANNGSKYTSEKVKVKYRGGNVKLKNEMHERKDAWKFLFEK